MVDNTSSIQSSKSSSSTQPSKWSSSSGETSEKDVTDNEGEHAVENTTHESEAQDGETRSPEESSESVEVDKTESATRSSTASLSRTEQELEREDTGKGECGEEEEELQKEENAEGNEEEEDEDEENEEEGNEEEQYEEETSVPSEGTGEYRIGEDGNIHLNEKQKSKVRELTQPDVADDFHLGFTKQGKPIVANPYYKYILRLREGTEVSAPKAPATQPHTSRLTRRSFWEENAEIPMGPSMKLEKIKADFVDWLSSLGDKRDMSITKERLEELFSLGLENNMVVRPPEIRMTHAGQQRPATARPQQQRAPEADTSATEHARSKSVAFRRSPSMTYYPELKRKWLAMDVQRELPPWQLAYQQAAPPPPEKLRYGSWYIPINKWTPLAGDEGLAPPETEEARELRRQELLNYNLNQELAHSHALSAMREYIRLCQTSGGDTFQPTPNMLHDVDELLEAERRAQSARPGSRHRGGQRRSPRRYTFRLSETGELEGTGTHRRRRFRVRKYRRLSYEIDRGPMLLTPPPLYVSPYAQPPVKTKSQRLMSILAEPASKPSKPRKSLVKKMSQQERDEIDVITRRQDRPSSLMSSAGPSSTNSKK